jgi:hypothetical protein
MTDDKPVTVTIYFANGDTRSYADATDVVRAYDTNTLTFFSKEHGSVTVILNNANMYTVK